MWKLGLLFCGLGRPFRLEENAKRTVPVPDCLLRGEPAGGYSKEDAEAIAAYEEKMRALRADRLAYRSTLEEKIERARGGLSAKATKPRSFLYLA